MGLGTQSLKQLWDSSPQSGTVCGLEGYMYLHARYGSEL